MELETKRLRLRRFAADDGGLLEELDSDPEVMRWLNGGHPTSREHIEHVVLPRLVADAHFAAFDRVTGAFVGRFSIADGHLGYRLRREYWGQGLATEGAREMIRYGFEDLGFDWIIAGTYEHNLASIRVMQKAGMTFSRRTRPTPEELADESWFQVFDTEPWDGDDVEYEIKRPGSATCRGGASRGAPPSRCT